MIAEVDGPFNFFNDNLALSIGPSTQSYKDCMR